MNAKEIIEFINNDVYDGRSKKLPGYTGVYAINVNGCIGIAIDTKTNEALSESFNKVKIEKCEIMIENIRHNVIFLYTKEKKLSSHYGVLCEDFISQSQRCLIETNPIKWFEEWKDLIGNKRLDKMVYDFIGEMKTLLLLKKKGLNPKWASINKGTYDIITNEALYEVKSTRSKILETIVIHNQYQLDTSELDKQLYIVFCRVEENNLGDSIDSLFNELVKNDFDEELLSKYLDESGYSIGKLERKKAYIVHEIRLYKVDNDFPKMNIENFKDNKLPNGVIGYQYTISLTSLPYEKIL